jgi:hypothetical protein
MAVTRNSGSSSVWDEVYALVKTSTWASVYSSVSDGVPYPASWKLVLEVVADSVYDSAPPEVRASVYSSVSDELVGADAFQE